MNINNFFHSICFGENGYILTKLDIQNFINEHSENIKELHESAKSFEGGVLLKKFLGHSETPINDNLPFACSTDDFNKYLLTSCGQWSLFMAMLGKKLEPFNKYESLRVALINNKHIEQPNKETFYSVLKNKLLPLNTEKIRWTGSKADAMYFQKEVLNFSLPEFNKCFAGDKPFHENMRQATKRSDDFLKICSLYPK